VGWLVDACWLGGGASMGLGKDGDCGGLRARNKGASHPSPFAAEVP